jgi:hypothetical protein
MKELDKYYPPCGKCWFCGHHDKRHRLWDAFLSMIQGGETPEFVAKLYDTPLDHVLTVIRLKPYQ